jgi:hypothetical protein
MPAARSRPANQLRFVERTSVDVDVARTSAAGGMILQPAIPYWDSLLAQQIASTITIKNFCMLCLHGAMCCAHGNKLTPESAINY